MTENTDLSRNNSWNENTMTKNIFQLEKEIQRVLCNIFPLNLSRLLEDRKTTVSKIKWVDGPYAPS